MLNDRLKDHEWLAADQYSIADIANFSWVGPCAWPFLMLYQIMVLPAALVTTAQGLKLHIPEYSAAWSRLVTCMSIAEGFIEDLAWLQQMFLLALQVFCYFWAGATIDDKPHLKGEGGPCLLADVATLSCLVSLGHTHSWLSINEWPLPVRTGLTS